MKTQTQKHIAEEKFLLSRPEAAARYGLGLRTLDRFLAEGVIPSVRLGRRCCRIPREAADAFFRKLTTGG